MNDVRLVLDAVRPKEEASKRELLKWIRVALNVLDLRADEVNDSNIQSVMQTAIELQKSDSITRFGRYDYYTESKRLPFDKFQKAVIMLWGGHKVYDVEKETEVGHNVLSNFNQWWKRNHTKYDQNNIKHIYRDFLRRNLKTTTE